MEVASLKPMLARLVRELPGEGFVFEPKWDGFRCLAGREGDGVELRSRHGRPLARYFPEITAALCRLDPERWVLDGELLVVVDGRFDFTALMQRLHPADSRVRELAVRTPAMYVAFDLPALAGEDLRQTPFAERRGASTAWWQRAASSDTSPGVRAMLKVKQERTADCVVAGMRVAGEPAEVTALMLGLYDHDGALEHIGVASSFARRARAALTLELAPLVAPLEGHPWEQGFLASGGPTGRLKGAAGRWMPGMTMDWVPLVPRRVCEVAYTQVDDHRLRHPAKFVRWRVDRQPRSCLVEQLEAPDASPGQVLTGAGPSAAGSS